MNRHLVLSFRFLAPWFHGRGDAGEPEWPPSPLRAVQAVVAAAARAGTLASVRTALTWLEQRAAPLILAPEAIESATGYRLSVPHNQMDLVARQWSRGSEGKTAEQRTMKNVRPRHLPDDSAVHYVWSLDADDSAAAALVATVRHVVALGWGLDLVVGHGAVIDDAQFAELSAALTVWTPRNDGSHDLRTAANGTFEDFERRHAAFLSRTSFAGPTLHPPPALSVFAITRYSRANQPPMIHVAGFALMRADSDNFRAFDTARRGKAVAGMLRHAVRTAAERAGWEPVRVNASVLGHGDGDEPRLLLAPVPSIEPRGNGGERVGAIRRVMLFSTDPYGSDTFWARRVLGGVDLIDEKTGEIQAVLAAASTGDRVLRRFTGKSRSWATVTPVVLPGHDDPGGLRNKLKKTTCTEVQKKLLERMMQRRETLVRKALLHAGLNAELAASATIEARESGFIAGVESASRYALPTHLATAPRLHVKLTFPHDVAGPLCIGSGRFSGLGLFAAVAT